MFQRLRNWVFRHDKALSQKDEEIGELLVANENLSNELDEVTEIIQDFEHDRRMARIGETQATAGFVNMICAAVLQNASGKLVLSQDIMRAAAGQQFALTQDAQGNYVLTIKDEVAQ